VGIDQRIIKAPQTTINASGIAAANLLGRDCGPGSLGLNSNQVVARYIETKETEQ
jgi:hypothetical protein